MSNRAKEIERLRRLYDAAFQQWALEVSRLQQLPSDDLGIRGAACRTKVAETTYRDIRDQLASEMAEAQNA
jgi:hypothetical protein